MKTTLHLKPNSLHLETVQIEDNRILCNDIAFPHEKGCHLYVIGNEYGPVGAVWARHEQNAFDELIDQGLGNAFLIDEKDVTEDTARLGNAGEPCNLDYAWIAEVEFDPARDWKLMLEFAEARGDGRKTLWH